MVFAKFGELIIRLFSFVGMLILAIPKIPGKIRNLNSVEIRNKIDPDRVRNNLSRVKNEVDNVKETYLGQNQVSSSSRNLESNKTITGDSNSDNSPVILQNGKYTSEEKERTVLNLQIASAAFIIFSILHIFNFLSLFVFL
ncbi:MAG: DUF2101 family protein, partial [Methanobacterium sp.]|nr:DUF2101 family protein [Methanobacterium sp.]